MISLFRLAVLAADSSLNLANIRSAELDTLATSTTMAAVSVEILSASFLQEENVLSTSALNRLNIDQRFSFSLIRRSNSV